MSTTTILRRKLRRPAVPENHVRRQALLDLLRAGLSPDKKLTAVSGGPGYGKSTLVADYAAWVGHPSAWYALDEGDADPVVFIAHLLAAVQGLFPGVGERAMELLRTARLTPAAAQNIIGMLADELADAAHEPWLLILDDVHFIQDVPVAERALSYLIQYFPDTAQLILIGRTMPDLKLPQLQVRQQVVQLATPELRLAPEEIAALFQAASAGAVTARDLEQLQAHTEGWLAGLILLLHTLQRRHRLPDQLASPVEEWHRPLFAYLAEEIFDDLPADWRRFLLETALPPHFDVEVCARVLGLAEPRDVIAQLLQRQLFIEAMDNEAYRYHPLFRDFLLARRARDEGREALRATYQRLAEYFQERQPEAAIACWLEAADYAAAEGSFRAQVGALLRAQRLDTVNRLLQQFPREARDGSPWLQLYAGELERQWGNFDRALAYLQRAQELAQAGDDPRARGWAMAYEGAIAGARGQDQLRPLAEAALEAFPTAERAGHAFALNLLGGYYLHADRHDPARASEYLHQALAHYQGEGDTQGQARALHNLGLAQTKLGQFEQAIATYREAITRAQEAGHYAIPLTYNNLGIVLLYQGRLAESREALEAGLALAQSLGTKRDEAWAYRSLGVLAAEEGNWSAASGYLEQARELAQAQGDRVLESNTVEAQAGLARRQGRPAYALDLMHQAMELRGLKPGDPGEIDFLLPLGLVHLDQGQPAEAEARFAAARERFEAARSPYHQAEATYLLARAALAAGDAPRAQELRADAARVAEAHGYTHLAARQEAHLQDATPAKARTAPLPPLQPADRPAISVRCFGAFEVEIEGQRVGPKAWRGVKTQVILAFLLHNRNGLTREQLSEMFYADQDTTPTAIYVLISRLRRALEPDLKDSGHSRFIQFHEGRYAFNFGVSYRLDTQEFRFSLDSARAPDLPEAESSRLLRRAVDLYEGPFLPAFYGESWVQVETEHYRRLALQAADTLLNRALAGKDFEEVLALADRTLKVDKCHEQAHQAKMLALVRSGQRELAMRHYNLMQKTLAKELGIEPSAATLDVYQSILKTS